MSGSQQISFIERKIDVTFTLVQGAKFAESGTNSVTLKGLRVSATIHLSGEVMAELQLRVYGLTMSMMNQLSTLGRGVPGSTPNNTISVSAGDDQAGMTTVFDGTIYQGWADFQGMPETLFAVSAYSGLYQAVASAPPSSYQGSADVATIMGQLAKQMGMTLENNGVDAKIANPYFPGSPRQQVEECARAADIYWTIDRNVLAIWPKSGYRKGDVPVLSPTTGMVGYPTFNSSGIVVSTLFKPGIKFGSLVEIKSSLTPACGKWSIYSMSHELESQTVGGNWFTRIEATAQGLIIK
jgi:hypothetical protein